MKHSWNSNTPQIHSSTAHALAHQQSSNFATIKRQQLARRRILGRLRVTKQVYEALPEIATSRHCWVGVFPTAQKQDIEIYWEAVAKSSRWFDDIWWFVFLLKDWKLQQIGDIGADGCRWGISNSSMSDMSGSELWSLWMEADCTTTPASFAHWRLWQ